MVGLCWQRKILLLYCRLRHSMHGTDKTTIHTATLLFHKLMTARIHIILMLYLLLAPHLLKMLQHTPTTTTKSVTKISIIFRREKKCYCYLGYRSVQWTDAIYLFWQYLPPTTDVVWILPAINVCIAIQFRMVSIGFHDQLPVLIVDDAHVAELCLCFVVAMVGGFWMAMSTLLVPLKFNFLLPG